jgi:hypothetical protein
VTPELRESHKAFEVTSKLACAAPVNALVRRLLTFAALDSYILLLSRFFLPLHSGPSIVTLPQALDFSFLSISPSS